MNALIPIVNIFNVGIVEVKVIYLIKSIINIYFKNKSFKKIKPYKKN